MFPTHQPLMASSSPGFIDNRVGCEQSWKGVRITRVLWKKTGYGIMRLTVGGNGEQLKQVKGKKILIAEHSEALCQAVRIRFYLSFFFYPVIGCPIPPTVRRCMLARTDFQRNFIIYFFLSSVYLKYRREIFQSNSMPFYQVCKCTKLLRRRL